MGALQQTHRPRRLRPRGQQHLRAGGRPAGRVRTDPRRRPPSVRPRREPSAQRNWRRGGSSAVVTVSGRRGSGKTALALRLLGRLMREFPTTQPRFITPSATLRAHLLDAVHGHSAARELFPAAGSLRSAARQAGALVIDEAQRINEAAQAACHRTWPPS
ncbi:DNA/RNA helicase domain-containing protein [Streptomyces sp. NBC_00233]|uniref:DNA/RNA helicase domain-containing protein n=1 Tax=Streptomyces sp. NBC_00233 TaxID=2975686 RepID=UPI002252DF22|nr:DNA/RNA helicase domain-containing protein [Streptomyces sp. NBC_00233]MCX5233058.1 ATP-binding protein [Streptomyces sp. NBC_00233]